jgi:hypothetical protein
MKRFVFVLIVVGLWVFSALAASADWRWAPPQFKPHKITYSCATLKCLRHTYIREKRRFQHKVRIYNKRRRREWHTWTSRYIPTCTWYGESGYGPQFSPLRYSMPNSLGSGAYGKYQMMPGTYHNQAKYHDWSPLDQEIAGHREYWAHGTSPWTNC